MILKLPRECLGHESDLQWVREEAMTFFWYQMAMEIGFDSNPSLTLSESLTNMDPPPIRVVRVISTRVTSMLGTEKQQTTTFSNADRLSDCIQAASTHFARLPGATQRSVIIKSVWSGENTAATTKNKLSVALVLDAEERMDRRLLAILVHTFHVHLRLPFP